MKKHFEIRESSSCLRVWYPFSSVWVFSFNKRSFRRRNDSQKIDSLFDSK